MKEKEIENKQKKLHFRYAAQIYDRSNLPADTTKGKGFIIFVPEVSGFKINDVVDVALKLTYRQEEK